MYIIDKIKSNFFKLYHQKDGLEYEMKDLMRIDNLFKTSDDLKFYIESIFMFEDEIESYKLTLEKMLRESESLELYEYCQIIIDKLSTLNEK